MKIVIVQSRLCFGGAEHVGMMLANALSENHEVWLATNTHLDISYMVSDRVKLCNIFPNCPHGPKKWMGAIERLHKLFKKVKPDVAIGILSTCSFICKVAGWGLGIPVIATEHDAFERPECAPMSKGNTFSKFWLNKLFDVVTVLTEADRKVIGNRLHRVAVMPNPLSLTPLSISVGGSMTNDEGKPVYKRPFVLAAGRLDAWHYKGFDLLLKAWARVQTACKEQMQREGWKLVIAGKDEAEGQRYLETLVHKYSLGDAVSFLGFRKDMARLYQESSIFVLSSRYEGFGLVLIEAMSQGCACVTTDYKGRQMEILGSEDCGMVCQPEDVDALAEALQRVMMDDELRQQLQRNAIARSRYFLPANIAKRWEQLIAEVVARKQDVR